MDRQTRIPGRIKHRPNQVCHPTEDSTMPTPPIILGQDHIKHHFQTAILTRKISHAYILSGEPGTGRSTLADTFAMTLLCESGQSDPCMQCHSCRQALSNNHPDLIHVTHKKSASIGVDDIREQINNTVAIRPYSGAYKIYIINESEKMTIQAQNALLKTIEEPPSYAVIILITSNPGAFLPTITSRCVQLKMRPLAESTIQNHLATNLSIPETKAEIYAAFARGNIGKAVQIAQSEDFQKFYEELIQILKNIHSMDVTMLLNYIKKIKEENFDIYECLDFMQIWYRDALMFKVTKDANLLIFKEEYSTINEMSRKTGYDGFENILQAIEKAKARLEANVNMELAMELMFLVMKEN